MSGSNWASRNLTRLNLKAQLSLGPVYWRKISGLFRWTCCRSVHQKCARHSFQAPSFRVRIALSLTLRPSPTLTLCVVRVVRSSACSSTSVRSCTHRAAWPSSGRPACISARSSSRTYITARSWRVSLYAPLEAVLSVSSSSLVAVTVFRWCCSLLVCCRPLLMLSASRLLSVLSRVPTESNPDNNMMSSWRGEESDCWLSTCAALSSLFWQRARSRGCTSRAQSCSFCISSCILHSL